jgi:hypothetical protein
MRHLLRFDPTLMTAGEAGEHVLAAGLTPLATFPTARVVLVQGAPASAAHVQGLALVESTNA